MVDKEAAVRMRRLRAHRAGDHSLCTSGRCEKATLRQREPAGVSSAATILAATAALVARLPFDETDPRYVSSLIALRLAKGFDETGNPVLSRELRVVLDQICEVPDESAGGVDEIRLRRHLRRVDSLIAAAEAQAVADLHSKRPG